MTSSGSHRTSSNASTSSGKTRPGSDEASPPASSNLRPHVRDSLILDSPTYPAMRSSSTDSLEAMQYRRASQAAESGQLQPRIGTRGQSSERSSAEWHRRLSSDITDSTLHEPRTPDDTRSSGLMTPEIHITGSSPPTSSGLVTPYDADAEYIMRQHPAPLEAHPRVVSEPHLTMPRRPSQSKRSSFSVVDKGHPQILRQVNPGFAVLRPGTLDGTSSGRTAAKADSSAEVDIEAQAGEGAEKRRSRRLQKRRPSQDSQGLSLIHI